jgi:hypothetical protein
MPTSPIFPRSVEKAHLLKRWWGRLFGPRFLPDTAGPHSEDKRRQEVEGMLRLGDEAPIANPRIETVDKLPDHDSRQRRTKTTTGRKAKR